MPVPHARARTLTHGDQSTGKAPIAVNVKHGTVANVSQAAHMFVAERFVQHVVRVVVHAVVERDARVGRPGDGREFLAEVDTLLVGYLSGL